MDGSIPILESGRVGSWSWAGHSLNLILALFLSLVTAGRHFPFPCTILEFPCCKKTKTKILVMGSRQMTLATYWINLNGIHPLLTAGSCITVFWRDLQQIYLLEPDIFPSSASCQKHALNKYFSVWHREICLTYSFFFSHGKDSILCSRTMNIRVLF